MRGLKVCIALLNIAVTVAFLYFENRLSPAAMGIAVLFFTLSSALHLTAHECGHLVGGAVSGYKLLCLQLGPLNIVSKKGKFVLVWKMSFDGQCVMIPEHTDPVRFMSYNIGGVIANALIAVLSFTALITGSFRSRLLFIELIFVGIQKILLNTIPHNTGSVPNAGYIVRLLKGNTAVQKDYAMYLRLYGKLFSAEDIKVQDFMYEREEPGNEEEMLYYNEIMDILNSVNSQTNK